MKVHDGRGDEFRLTFHENQLLASRFSRFYLHTWNDSLIHPEFSPYRHAVMLR
jgi:hypothetical protein